MNIRDIYRANDVMRWQIVKTIRQQSVAEHSFNVAMIAMDMAVRVDFDAEDIKRALIWSLMHDIPEVFIGDIATPVKREIERYCLDESPIKDMEVQMCGVEFYDLWALSHKESPHVGRIVKLADLADAIKFLDENAPTEHGEIIQDKLRYSFDELLKSTIKEYDPNTTQYNPAKRGHDFQGHQCAKVLEELMKGEQTFLDSIL